MQYSQERYYEKENELRIIDDGKKVEVWMFWGVINCQGKIVFEIFDGIQNSEEYLNRLKRNFPRMGIGKN